MSECLVAGRSCACHAGEVSARLGENWKVEDDLLDPLSEAAVGEALALRFHQTPASPLRVEHGEKQVRIVIGEEASAKMIYQGADRRCDHLPKTFDRLVKQVSTEERSAKIESAQARLVEIREAIQNRIDAIVLRGRPDGRSSLCPGSAA